MRQNVWGGGRGEKSKKARKLKANSKKNKQKKTGIRGSNLCLPLVRLTHQLSYLIGQLKQNNKIYQS